MADSTMHKNRRCKSCFLLLCCSTLKRNHTVTVYLLLSESRHHLTPSNVTSQNNHFARYNSDHLAISIISCKLTRTSDLKLLQTLVRQEYFYSASAINIAYYTERCTSNSKSACPSIRPSHAGTVSKRLALQSCGLLCTAGQSHHDSSFLMDNLSAKFERRC